jgi:4-oxalocrotonate tautomerase
MPVVQVDMWEGRTVEQKTKLIEFITNAFEEIGVKPSSQTTIFHDIPKTNCGLRGAQAS